MVIAKFSRETADIVAPAKGRNLCHRRPFIASSIQHVISNQHAPISNILLDRQTAEGAAHINLGDRCVINTHRHRQRIARAQCAAHSECMVPLHPALIAEGFLQHAAELPAGSPLFPDLRPDGFGMLKGMATKKHGRWVRKVVGLTDKTKDPAQAWRHRFEDQARRAGVPQNVTDGLLGHLNPMNESEGYGRGFRFMPDVSAQWVERMKAPDMPVGTAPVARTARRSSRRRR